MPPQRSGSEGARRPRERRRAGRSESYGSSGGTLETTPPVRETPQRCVCQIERRIYEQRRWVGGVCLYGDVPIREGPWAMEPLRGVRPPGRWAPDVRGAYGVTHRTRSVTPARADAPARADWVPPHDAGRFPPPLSHPPPLSIAGVVLPVGLPPVGENICHFVEKIYHFVAIEWARTRGESEQFRVLTSWHGACTDSAWSHFATPGGEPPVAVPR